jgi:hypothetical protein
MQQVSGFPVTPPITALGKYIGGLMTPHSQALQYSGLDHARAALMLPKYPLSFIKLEVTMPLLTYECGMRSLPGDFREIRL